MKNWDILKGKIKEYDKIVFLGGAGVSTESGIPDFRSKTGLYSSPNKYKYPPEVMLSRDFFNKYPEEFFTFYKEKMVYPDLKPNKCHYALAALEKAGKLRAIITQNIDGLHQAAGSKNVIELHGGVSRNFCKKCNKFYSSAQLLDILKASPIPYCDDCGGIIKPDVVLYQEQLDRAVISKAVDSIAKAEVLIVAGTSLTVNSAAGMLRFFDGDFLAIINKDETFYDDNADVVIRESLGEVMDYVVH